MMWQSRLTASSELDITIMASRELSARLRYLNESAQLLATTAPTTSRFLMSRRNSLIFESGRDRSEAQKRDACGACGTITIPGWESKIQLPRQQIRKGKNKISQAAKTKVVFYTCEACRRKTCYSLDKPQMPRHTLGSSKSNITELSATPKEVSTIPSSTSSSRKRAKSRKQGCLEALLARKKPDTRGSGAFGLDLMDFMKKS
jgi:RNase P subunit RPR2